MKYQPTPKWDRHRPEFLQVGFIIAIGFVLTAFNYTSKINKDDLLYEESTIAIDILEVVPPRTPREQRVLPPPPEPKLDLVQDIINEAPEFTETPPEPETFEPTTESDAIIDEYASPSPANDIPPIVAPIIPEAPEDEGPVLMADRMPVYASCDIEGDEATRRSCTSDHLMSFIYEHVKYPTIARQNGIEGTVVVSFVVNKSGDVENIEIMHDIGGGCGDAVVETIRRLGQFYPGKQNGRPVSVIYRLPVKFLFK